MSGSGLLDKIFFFPAQLEVGLVGWLVDVGIIIYMRCYDAGEDEGLFGEWEIGGGKRERKRCKAEEVFFILLFFSFLLMRLT